MLALLAPFWDQLRPPINPMWAQFGGYNSGIAKNHSKHPQSMPPKRSPPWPSTRNRINSNNHPKNKTSSKTLIPMAGKHKMRPKIIEKCVSKKLTPMAGTAKRSRARLKERGPLPELYDYDVFVEVTSSKARAPIARKWCGRILTADWNYCARVVR